MIVSHHGAIRNVLIVDLDLNMSLYQMRDFVLSKLGLSHEKNEIEIPDVEAPAFTNLLK